jgi:outer membrane biosynthesis protein TonB
MVNPVAAPVTTADWCAELEDLATRASLMERSKEVSLSDRLELATAAFSRLWLAWSPAVIARSCRASATLLDPVLVEPGPLDQQLAAVRAFRLEALARIGTLEQPAEIAPVLPGLDDDEPKPNPEPEPPPAPAPIGRPRPQLRPASERMRRPAPEAQPPEPPKPSTSPPADWWDAEEVAALVGKASETISRWRREGRMGAEGSGWQRCGRSYYYAPQVVEDLEKQLPAGLNELVADVQAP